MIKKTIALYYSFQPTGVGFKLAGGVLRLFKKISREFMNYEKIYLLVIFANQVRNALKSIIT